MARPRRAQGASLTVWASLTAKTAGAQLRFFQNHHTGNRIDESNGTNGTNGLSRPRSGRECPMLLGIGTWSGGDHAQNCWHRGNGVSSAPHHPKGECRRKKMGECRRKNEECRKGSGSRSAGCFHSTFCILHSAFCILHFHSWGEGGMALLFSVGARTLGAAQQRRPAAPTVPGRPGTR